MHPAKLSMSIAVTVLVVAELLCAPICDLNCSVYGSSITAVKTDSNDAPVATVTSTAGNRSLTNMNRSLDVLVTLSCPPGLRRW
jgi:hypothetical protein